jgi:hypothetical protein
MTTLKWNLQKLLHWLYKSPKNSSDNYLDGCTTISISKGNLVEVNKTPPKKPFHEGGDAFILDPNHKNGILCQFILGGKKVVAPKRILCEKNIDTVSRQWTCHKALHLSLLSTYHSSKRWCNATEKEAPHQKFNLYQKLFESENWG